MPDKVGSGLPLQHIAAAKRVGSVTSVWSRFGMQLPCHNSLFDPWCMPLLVDCKGGRGGSAGGLAAE